MSGNHGHFGGFFCVFLLLTLVAMLAVTSLIIQIFTWKQMVQYAKNYPAHLQGVGVQTGGRSGGEPELVVQIRERLAMLQIDNGAGPPIQHALDNRRDGYRGESRVWTMAVPYFVNSNLAYYDITSGKYGGYYVDVTHEVCKTAGKNCRFVQSNSGTGPATCWELDEEGNARGGVGLHSQWIDACVGYSPTLVRSLTFDFTDSIVPPTQAFFYTLPGNPYNFNWRDLRGKKIGFPARWYTDPNCVARNAERIQGSKLDPSQIVFYNDIDDIFGGLQRREVDAAFFPDELEDLASSLLVASDAITTCTIDGDALMVRKDSYVPEWFNPAFQTVLKSREYREICKDVDDYYKDFLGGRDSEFVCRDF